MNSVGVRRTLAKCLVVLAVCFALNLIAPVVISQQRTIHPRESRTITFDGPASLTVELTTGKGPKSGQVSIQAAVSLDGAPLADSMTASASSALPVDGRAGLTYLFPYRPERLSYPYTDPFAPETFTDPARMDYVGPGSVGGLDTYKYRAGITADGHSAERIIDLQVQTGEVLDETWSVAEGPVEGLFRMSEQSRFEAHERAAAEVRVLHALQVLAWVTRFVAFVALVRAAVAVARR
ncbi:porin PorA family protein [Corynebacterium qintianiae]|uniref:porin PorA family protein n=1 Tax=Corynebacterium qintianiae TaxID=2709392 RepID=UPI0013ECA95B|nr:porin PorA family protein [Corynebacterium qintianiae]